MKRDLAFDFSVEKDNNTIRIKKDLPHLNHKFGAHGQLKNSWTNSGVQNLGM